MRNKYSEIIEDWLGDSFYWVKQLVKKYPYISLVFIVLLLAIFLIILFFKIEKTGNKISSFAVIVSFFIIIIQYNMLRLTKKQAKMTSLMPERIKLIGDLKDIIDEDYELVHDYDIDPRSKNHYQEYLDNYKIKIRYLFGDRTAFLFKSMCLCGENLLKLNYNTKTRSSTHAENERFEKNYEMYYNYKEELMKDLYKTIHWD